MTLTLTPSSPSSSFQDNVLLETFKQLKGLQSKPGQLKIENIQAIYVKALGNCKERLDLSDKLVARLEIENATKSSENAQQLLLIQQAVQSRNIFQQQYQVLDVMLKNLKEQTVPLIDQIQKLNEDFVQIFSKTAEVSKKQEETNVSIEKLGDASKALDTKSKQLQTDYTQLQGKVETLQDRTTGLDKKTQQFLSECAELQTTLHALDKQTHALNEKSDSLTKESETLHGAFTTLKQETGDLHTVTDQMALDYNKLQTSFTTLDDETKELNTNFTKIGKKYQALRGRYKQLDDVTGALKEQYDAISDQYDNLNDLFINLGNETRHLKQVTQQMRVDYNTLKGVYSVIKTRTDNHESQIDFLSLKNDKKDFCKAKEKFSGIFSKGTGVVSLGFLVTAYPLLSAFVITFIAYQASYFIGRIGVRYYREHTLEKFENEFIQLYPQETPRKAFEYAQKECQKLKGHPLFGLIWS
ncbi:MAG: hypothetical protein H0W88_02685 [Parachlamydiaceae bacterium]|nr:hypothetical protein [Parachlamydiaceae bacterium]